MSTRHMTLILYLLYNMLQHTATRCNTLTFLIGTHHMRLIISQSCNLMTQCVAVCCSVLQCVAVWCSVRSFYLTVILYNGHSNLQPLHLWGIYIHTHTYVCTYARMHRWGYVCLYARVLVFSFVCLIGCLYACVMYACITVVCRDVWYKTRDGVATISRLL